MKFSPLSEKEAAAQSANLWPDGEYDYTVRAAEEKLSGAGNEMTELQVTVFDSEGTEKLVYDYLVSSPKSAWKIRHFAASCGLLSKYETGSLEAFEMVGRPGRCVLASRPAKDGYPAKNVIRDYVATSQAQQTKTPAKAPADDLSDEIPF